MIIAFDNPAVERVEGFEALDCSPGAFTYSKVRIRKNAVLPEHKHPHLQITICLSGRFELVINGTRFILEEGSICEVPSNALHSGISLTDCEVLEIFYPIRQDFLK